MTQAEDDGVAYATTTREIMVTVRSYYLEEQSSPDDSRYVFAYRVRIENHGEATVQLRSRYWRITDGNGHTEEVRGAGVVGEQPVLAPGEAFEYTSGTPLMTESGFMVGHYEMVAASGEQFDVDVPAFALDRPNARNHVH